MVIFGPSAVGITRLIVLGCRPHLQGCNTRQQFIGYHLPIGSHGQVRSVCGRFGVIAAAGEMATEWNIVPWSAGEATQAALTCFMAWLAGRGGIGAGEVHAAFRQVQAFFGAQGTTRFG